MALPHRRHRPGTGRGSESLVRRQRTLQVQPPIADRVLRERGGFSGCRVAGREAVPESGGVRGGAGEEGEGRGDTGVPAICGGPDGGEGTTTVSCGADLDGVGPEVGRVGAGRFRVGDAHLQWARKIYCWRERWDAVFLRSVS